MIPLEITLKDFLGYDDNEGEPYTYDFRDHRLWSISGDNGAGKSALFDVITYTLFGRHRGGASHHEELLRKGATQMSCSFTFEHNQRAYRVTRTIKKRIRRSGEPAYEHTCQLDWYDTKAYAWREVPDTATASALEEYVRIHLLGFDYDTFISSVMLVQGDSDKLLRAPPRDRFGYLSGILDLRQYKRLEDRAASRAKTLHDQRQLLATTLGEIGMPSEEQVNAANATAAEEEQAAVGAQTQLTDMENRVKRIQAYHAQASRRAGFLQTATEMADAQVHAKEIRSAVEEKDTISRILPRICDARDELQKADLAAGQAKAAQEELAKIDLDAVKRTVIEAEAKHRDAKNARDVNGRLLRSKQQDRRAVEPELKRARRLEELEASIKEAKTNAESLRLETTGLPEARDRLARLDALNLAWPLVKPFTEARRAEAEVLTWLGDRGLDAVVGEAAAEHELAKQTVGQLRQQVDDQQTDAGRLQGELAVAKRSLDDRRKAGAEGTCSHCGQPVSPQHIKSEIANCRAEVAKFVEAVAQATNKLETDRGALAELEDQLPKLRRAEELAADQVKLLKDGRTRLVEFAQEEAMLQLPVDCRRVLEGPIELIADGIEPFQLELGGRVDCRSTVAGLAEKDADLRSQRKLVAGLEKQKASVLALITARRARAVKAKADGLDKAIVELDEANEGLAKGVAGAEGELEVARSAQVEATRKRDELKSKAQIQATAAQGHRSSARTAVRGVDAKYLPPSQDRIVEVEGRLEQLVDADKRLALLQSAERQLDSLRGQIKELDEVLAKVPEADRIPVEDAQPVAELARAASKVAQERAQSARERAITLGKERQERLAMQRQADDLARSHKVWDRLAKLLGRGGLQLALMKHDLAEIQKLANATLVRISGGNLQLVIECSRGRGGEEIVFRCVDGASADEALDVAFLSGGQKFRVAVALACGIGQYAGVGGSMPSEIIDEGFGSLDENGRKEMLDVIREMSEHFERIIVVSHTDSFHDPTLFPARYELRKDGRKTLVTKTA